MLPIKRGVNQKTPRYGLRSNPHNPSQIGVVKPSPESKWYPVSKGLPKRAWLYHSNNPPLTTNGTTKSATPTIHSLNEMRGTLSSPLRPANQLCNQGLPRP